MTATDPAPIPLTEGNASGAAQVMAALAEPFDPAEVKWKPQSVKGNRALALCYIDARHVMDRLDAVLGSENWQDDYEVLPEGSVVCRLRLGIGGHWITKTDVGSLSEQPDGGDRMKAAFSDALKRAAVKFGVGRYLYRLDQTWVDYDPKARKFVGLPPLPDWARPKPPAGARKPTPASPAAAAPKRPAPAAPPAKAAPTAPAATPTDFSVARVRDLLVECYGYRESSDAHAADTRLKLLTHLGVPDMDPSQLTRDNLNRLGELCLKIVKKYGAPAPKGSGS